MSLSLQGGFGQSIFTLTTLVSSTRVSVWFVIAHAVFSTRYSPHLSYGPTTHEYVTVLFALFTQVCSSSSPSSES